MRRLCMFVLTATVSIAAANSAAQTPGSGTDTSQWQCKWCPGAKNATEGEVQAGLGYVTNDSFKFGQYTGLDEQGVYALADAEVRGRGERGGYFNVQGYNLGLDSRQISAETGIQGTGEIRASYDQLPNLVEDTARTPYSGDSLLSLPTGWVPAANTSGMTQLPAALHDVDLYTERRNAALGATYFQTAALSYDFAYQHETKEGKKSTGLAFGIRSAIVPIPVDYETDTAKFGVNYRAHRWQASANYVLSSFENQNYYIRWDNAFAADSLGQAAQEPDNTMQQLALNGAFKIIDTWLLSAQLAYGELRQDEKYLPYTVNHGITAPALPRDSLDGKINTVDAMINLHAGLTEKLRLQLQYNQHEQDNATARATYDYVVTDTSLGTPRANLPYSFRQRVLSGELQYAVNQRHRIAGGTDYEIYDRTYQEVDSTDEYRLWGLYKALLNKVEIQARLDYADRQGDAYEPVSEVTPPQNPLMRKYNMADRVRNEAGVSLNYFPFNALNLGVNATVANDDYRNSSLGLQESSETGIALDLNYAISQALNVRALYSLTNIDSTQSGSAAFAAPDWQADNEDRMDVLDFGVLYKLMADKLDLGFDYTYATSKGKITVDDSEFPELTTQRHTFRIYGDYRLAARSYLNVAFLYEQYDEEDWATDGVTVNSINNVLSLGEVSPSYDIGYFTVMYRYAF